MKRSVGGMESREGSERIRQRSPTWGEDAKTGIEDGQGRNAFEARSNGQLVSVAAACSALQTFKGGWLHEVAALTVATSLCYNT